MRLNFSQSGFGMLEILIAITIAAFGLLGMAGLQAASLRYQKTAQFRSIANIAVSDMVERIHTNISGARSGEYGTSSGESQTGVLSSCNGVDACTVQELATFDVANWQQDLSRNLPDGRGAISGDVQNGMTIEVCYKDLGLEGNASDKNGIRCLSTIVVL